MTFSAAFTNKVNPHYWNVGPHLVAPAYRELWRGLEVVVMPGITNPNNSVAMTQNRVPGAVKNRTFSPSSPHDIFVVPSKFGPVYDMDSTSDHLVSDTVEDAGSGAVTVATLVRVTNDMARDHRIIGQWVSPRRFLMWMDTGANNGYAWIVGTTSGINRTGETQQNATLNTWALVIGTHDQKKGTKLYVDGVLIQTDATFLAPIDTSGTLPLRLGGDETAGDALWGQMAFTYIWDRAINETEIALLNTDPFGLMRPELSLPGTVLSVSVSLYATADGTIVNVVNEADAASPLWSSVDDDPATPTDSDWVNNTGTTGSTFFDLTNMPTDFGSADSSQLTIRVRGVDYGGVPMQVVATIYAADETTPYSDSPVVATVSANTSFANEAPAPLTLNAAGLAANKAAWDAAKLQLVWSVV